MNTQTIEPNSNRPRRKRAIGKILIGTALLAVVAALVFLVNGGSGDGETDYTTATAHRGDLVIDVVESGNLEASESLEIKSKVEGRTTIISIVPEGTIVTDQDIKDGKVLVELDSSDLRNKQAEQDISLESVTADYTDAKESYEIQVNQNESNQKTGELAVKFARMDLEKYVGADLVEPFVDREATLRDMIESDGLGGEALQKMRELESDIRLASEEVERATSQVEWTRRLADEGYVTTNEFEADLLAYERQKVSHMKAVTALDLYERYEFPKEAEKLRSDYEEAMKELERIIAKNRAELSKAEAKLKSASATLVRKRDELKRTKEQIENCTIRATKPGLVVYAGSDHPWHNVNIAEGAEVHENMDILKIPNSSQMVVKTKIHESMIARVHEGQKAVVTVDAVPDEVFDGVVSKVGIVPDSQNRWFNPDLRVYLTDVTVTGCRPKTAEAPEGKTPEGEDPAPAEAEDVAAVPSVTNGALKPGMSAEARIIIDRLEDVLMVPVEAVSTVGGERVCFVMTPSGPKKRPVETGDFNDVYIEIQGGLKDGEQVVLNPSALVEESKSPLPRPPALPGETGMEEQGETGSKEEPPAEQPAEVTGGGDQSEANVDAAG